MATDRFDGGPVYFFMLASTIGRPLLLSHATAYGQFLALGLFFGAYGHDDPCRGAGGPDRAGPAVSGRGQDRVATAASATARW